MKAAVQRFPTERRNVFFPFVVLVLIAGGVFGLVALLGMQA